MRRAARTDSNQGAIVAALRSIGCSVQPLHTIGKGCPDLLVSTTKETLLMEIKDPTKPKADRQLTPDQEKWHKGWKGRVLIIETVEQALNAISGKSSL